MNVGIDIDGFLTDIATFQLEQGLKYFDNIVNRNGYTIREIFNCSKKDEAKFWIKNFKYCFKDVRPQAKEFIEYIRNNGGKVYIITSRALSAKNSILGLFMRSCVKLWLAKNGIKYDGIAFCNEDKTKVIKMYDIEVMGEDSPHNINVISDYVKVICMSAPYNTEVESDNVYKVEDFNEAIDVYEKLLHKKRA